MPELRVDPPPMRYTAGVFVRAGLWLFVLALGIWFLTRIQFTLTIFGLAWLIAYLMNPIVEALEGRRLGPIQRCSRGQAVAGIYLLVLALLALAGSLLVPAASAQIDRLMALQHSLYNPQELAAIIQQRGERLVQMVPVEYQQQIIEKLRESIGTITAHAGRFIANLLSHLAGFFGQVLAGTAVFFTALLISIYMLLSWTELNVAFLNAFPGRYKDEATGLIADMNLIFRGYLRATIVTSVATAVSTYVTLWLYSLITGNPVPYNYIISLVAGLLYPIPLFGILASTALALVLGLIPDGDVHNALMVGGLVFVVNNIIDRTILPWLMSDAMGVSPLFVIFAAAAGGEFLGGVWGMLLGIPLAAMAKTLLVWFHSQFLVTPKPEEPALLVPAEAKVEVVPEPEPEELPVQELPVPEAPAAPEMDRPEPAPEVAPAEPETPPQNEPPKEEEPPAPNLD